VTDTAPDILVVDDNQTNIMVLQAMLRMMGYRCRTALDGAQAICAADTPVPSLILMDLSMPGISGIDAALAIRAQHPGVRIPIVAVTSHDTRQYRTACAEAGFDAFITKPVDLNRLRATIEAQLAD
jgi:CheY-like chemotaxis protein